MNRPPRGDAHHLDVLRQIIQLEESIATTQRKLASARTALDSASKAETSRRDALRAIDDRIRAIGKDVLRRHAALHLSGGSHNRGFLSLGAEAVRFSGWRGHVEIPLAAITDVQVGTSDVPPRAGIPVIDRLWPGAPRQTSTLLLTVQLTDDAAPHLAIMADVPDAVEWSEQIRDRQQRLDTVATERASLQTQREAARVALGAASDARRVAQDRLASIENEIASAQAQLRRAQQEKLKLPYREVDAALEDMIRAEHAAMKRLEES